MSPVVILAALVVVAVLLIALGLLLPDGKSRKPADPMDLPPAPDVSPRASPAVKAVFLLVPLAIAVIAAIVIALALLWRLDYDASADWPTTSGTIAEASIERHRNRSDEDNPDDYTVKLTYHYTVDGQQYTNDAVYFSLNSRLEMTRRFESYRDAQNYLGTYQPGQPVPVHYDPDDPQQAVLERRFDTLPFVIAIGGGMLGAAIGLAALLYGLANLNNQRAPF